MNPALVLAQLLGAVAAAADFPSYAREIYEADGWQIIRPNSAAGLLMGFYADDWHDDSMLARRGLVVRVVLVRARQPLTGAFTRLRDGLETAGLAVEIDTPVGPWRNALLRQGYRGLRTKHGEIWRRA